MGRGCRGPRVFAVVWLVVAAAVCRDGSDPAGVSESDLVFVRFPPDLLPLVAREGSVWAVKGRDARLVLRYQPEEPGREGEEFLEFRVPGDGLLRWPDGRLFVRGDSVRITVRVDEGGRFLFEFEPSGLVFDPGHPAELEVTYRRADRDFDGDGDEDAEDERAERRLSLWKRERPGGAWERVGSVRVEELEEVRARITGFTGFALASN